MLNLGVGTYLLELVVRGVLELQESWDLPAHPVVRNLPSIVGELGSIPGWETKSLCALGQLNPWAAAVEPSSPRTCAPQRRPDAAKLKKKNPLNIQGSLSWVEGRLTQPLNKM